MHLHHDHVGGHCHEHHHDHDHECCHQHDHDHERAIRHAITQTFSRGSDGYRAALGRLASSVGDKPTNAEFLAQTAECLRLGA